MADDDDFNREWTTDAHGNRVRRGLTVAETEELEKLRAQSANDEPHDRKRLTELWNKHELARRQAIGAEAQARGERKH